MCSSEGGRPRVSVIGTLCSISMAINYSLVKKSKDARIGNATRMTADFIINTGLISLDSVFSLHYLQQ
jgi:hypothetical protein